VTGASGSVSPAALVVCTRDRPDELHACLASVRAQTAVPTEVLVVDASAGDLAGCVVEELAGAWPAGSTLVRVAADPGLTHQRNVGIDATAGDPVLFVDDDTLLEPGYVAAVVDAFGAPAAGAAIVGVGGFVTNQPEHRHRAVDRWLLLDGAREGAVLRSGRNVRVYREPDSLLDVDWLPGCAMAYRRAVLARERPDGSLGPDRNGEDVHLSTRAARHGRLVVAPGARLTHLESPAGRRGPADLAAIELVSRYERVRDGLGPTSRPAFWWSAFGQLGWYAAKAALTGSRERAAIAAATWRGIRAARAVRAAGPRRGISAGRARAAG
jgi:GT2 family glycosyltransferase